MRRLGVDLRSDRTHLAIQLFLISLIFRYGLQRLQSVYGLSQCRLDSLQSSSLSKIPCVFGKPVLRTLQGTERIAYSLGDRCAMELNLRKSTGELVRLPTLIALTAWQTPDGNGNSDYSPNDRPSGNDI